MKQVSRSAPATALAVLGALILLADVPGLFTRGDVLRAVGVSFLAAVAAALGALMPLRPRLPIRQTGLLLLPLAIPLLGLLPPRPDLPTLFRLATGWVVLVALPWGLLRTRPAASGSADADFAGRLLGLAGAGAGLWVVVQALVSGDVGVGPFGRPGIAGPVLAALAVLAWVRAARPEGTGPLVVRAATVLFPLAGLVLTRSRTGIVAFVLGALLAWALATHGKKARRLRATLAASTALLLLVVVATAAGKLSIPGSAETVQVRTGLWAATTRLVGERPLRGHGLGSFPAAFLRVREVEEARLSRGRRTDTAHNDALQVAAEGGILAGTAFLLWIGGVLVAGSRRRRRAAEVGLFATLVVASFGENIFLDPAGQLLAGFAIAGILTPEGTSKEGPSEEGTAGRGGGLLLGLVLALTALAGAAVFARGAVADRWLRRYRDALATPLSVIGAIAHANQDLEHGALAWRRDNPEVWYRLGASRARFKDFDGALQAYGEALDLDPGMTEARLDIARIHELQQDVEAARKTLLEARRHDPTRFELPIRLGHLDLGTASVPGEPPGEDFDPVPALRHYNEARALDPERFEGRVAEARMARLQGDLRRAGTLLREALAQVSPEAAAALASPVPKDAGLPEAAARAWVNRQALTLNLLATKPETAEILLESTRLAEVEQKAPASWVAGLLELALLVNPRLGPAIEREAERFLALGAMRVQSAREAVASPGVLPDYSGAQRALDAASLRWAGLLRAGLLDPALFQAAAEQAALNRGFRVAYARYRALLSWALTRPTAGGGQAAERMDRIADLYVNAAKSASRFDGALSRHLYERGHATAGMAFLARGAFHDAIRMLELAAEEDPDADDVQRALARARARAGQK